MKNDLYIVVERESGLHGVGRVRYVERVGECSGFKFPYPYGLHCANGPWFDPSNADEVRREYGRMLSNLAVNDQLHRLDPEQLRLPRRIEDVLEPIPFRAAA